MKPRVAPNPSSRDELIEQILGTWRVNNAITLLLIDAISTKGLRAVPLASRGRDVAHQLAHMHKVRAAWMRYNKFKEANRLPIYRAKDTPTRAQLKSAFRASGKAVELYVREKLADGSRIHYFKGKPIRWLAYMISHESHHRGQIALALKQNGMRLPERIAIGALWLTWYWGKVD